MVWRKGVMLGLALGAGLGAGLRAEEMQRFDAAGGTPAAVWSLAVGETSREEDQVDGVAVDGDGNATLTGVFRGRLDLGSASFNAQGRGDIFVASYARDGSFRWARQIGGGGDDNAYDMAVDGAGNIYVSGWFAETVDFGGGYVLESRGSQDMFVVKLDAGGNTIWARSFGGRQGDGGNEIAVLPGGDIAVAGISEGDFVVDGQVFEAGGGERDSYVMRMNRSGEVLWVVPASGPGNERIRAISLNEAGEVFVGFQYRGGLRMGGLELGSYGNWDGAVAKLSSGGGVEWLLPVGGSETDNVRGVAAAPDGSVYISGEFSGPAVMIDREVPSIGAKGDEFLIRLASNGAPRWIVSMGGPGSGNGAEIEADARGVIVSSSIEAATEIRLNRDTIAVIEPQGPSAYLAGFTDDGQMRFFYMPSAAARRSGTQGSSVAVTPDGRYVVQALRFRGTIEAAGRLLETQADRDSAIVFLALNGG
jgi:hypothetical protein